MENITLHTGGVPEHFNLPWHQAMEKGTFEKAGILLNWQDYGGGTGAMASALKAGKLDMALLLTEGAVADIVKGSNYKIAGLFVESPLIWGIHVHQSSPFKQVKELEGKKFAISRFGSGSHLMAFVNAQQQGWNPAELSFEIVGNLEGAREALAERRGDAFMWEKFMTKPLVDSGEWRRAGECPTPWPCFVLVVRNETAEKFPEEIQKVTEIIRQQCRATKQHPGTAKLVASRYGLKEEDASLWFKDVKWAEDNSVKKETLQQVSETLYQLKLIDHIPEAEKLCNSFCRLI